MKKMGKNYFYLFFFLFLRLFFGFLFFSFFNEGNGRELKVLPLYFFSISFSLFLSLILLFLLIFFVVSYLVLFHNQIDSTSLFLIFLKEHKNWKRTKKFLFFFIIFSISFSLFFFL